MRECVCQRNIALCSLFRSENWIAYLFYLIVFIEGECVFAYVYEFNNLSIFVYYYTCIRDDIIFLCIVDKNSSLNKFFFHLLCLIHIASTYAYALSIIVIVFFIDFLSLSLFLYVRLSLTHSFIHSRSFRIHLNNVKPSRHC